MTNETIAVIAFDSISAFHLSVPCAVFGTVRRVGITPPFDVIVCAAEAGLLRSDAGIGIVAGHTLDDVARAGVVIVPSWRDTDEEPPEVLLEALRAAHRRGAVVVGLCLGAFVLAAAGLLQHRPATTHWGWTGELARRYPDVAVRPDVLYVDDGDVITSAGVAAGIDCCLHLLRRLRGAEAAAHVARRMVVPPHRQGGQAQYIETPVPKEQNRDGFSRHLEWVQQHLDQPHTIDALAERCAMSRRTFTRHFRQRLGTTLSEWLTAQRLALAQRLLETTDKRIDVVAQEAGFGSEVTLRQYFSKTLLISPVRYRKEFRGHLRQEQDEERQVAEQERL
ncbi:GlxA family transcriptional regulator [Geomesophilobacter sediminis]|uniref:Helix-turn-helix domain-containing protein n=1 Tax=Geomesophilobacter sediminis TaxID=2798584 RepID=A0A8J7JJN4_9BACT|nr:helix-turn-helix domain-containing protein [Geomesophilobacter sediminis]MBJ6723095.1 helix-turn-helix domain-containing protein [Geomesophilobacter sediminis]